MYHDINENKLHIVNSNLSFEDIYSCEDFPPSLLESIKESDILLLPYENFRDHTNCFPELTFQLFSYLKEEAEKDDLKIEIAVTDENYKEIELHSDIVNIAKILIPWVLLPIVTNWIASFVYDLIKQRNRKVDLSAEISVIKNGETKIIKYEGDIESFEKAMRSINENIFDE